MSSSAAGTSASRPRGRYSARACNGCRRRRVKCDGKQPVCETCASHDRQCEWSAEADARRPVTKQLVESLHARIQELEAELDQLGGKAAPVANDPTTAATSTASQNRTQDWMKVEEGENLLELVEDISDVERLPTLACQFTPTAMYQYIFQIDTDTPAVEQPRDVQLSLVCDWSRHLPELPNTQLSRLEHDTLLLRCFKYGTSWLLGIVPELFLHDMLYSLTTELSSSTPLDPPLQHYTPLLHCSIMAFACAFSDDPDIRAPATRARFAEYAKQRLDEEFNQPVMGLVSALILLSDYHCAIGELESGYMYMGMGLRAARLLAFTRDSTLDSGEDIAMLPEPITRNWYIWSAFAHDKLMAIEFKREYDMPVPHVGVSLPSIVAELDRRPWPLEEPVDSTSNAPPARLTTLVLQETSKLVIIATRIIEMSVPGEPIEDHVILNVHLRLDTWFNSLPEKLLVWARSASPLPHVIVLHICYWWLLIVLHEPLCRTPSEIKGNPQEHGAEQYLPITDLSIKVYYRAAHKIVQLMTMFDGQYGLKFFPRNMMESISSCGSALLRELTATHPGAQKKRSTVSDSVSTCINALRTISGTWPAAEERANNLQLRLQEVFTPVFPISQVDGPADIQVDEEERDLDDAMDISTAFYQYMHEWGSMSRLSGST